MSNEEKRSEALHAYNILDTPPEKAFDDLTALVAEICETPIAIISLLDGERHWFKSKVGIDLEETPEEISFCQYVVSECEVLNIPDTEKDERFKNNPYVVNEPRVRFYCGAPLKTDRGEILGALCVLDQSPRKLTDKQIFALRILSNQVVTQLEVRRQFQLQQETLNKLQSQSDLLDLAQDAILVRDLEHRVQYWNKGATQLYGWTEEEAIGQLVTDLIYQDQDEFLAVAKKVAELGEWSNEITQFTKDGRQLLVEGRWSMVRDDNGNPSSILSINTNITEKRESERVIEDSQNLIQMASRISKMGAWSVEIPSGEHRWSDETRELHGVEESEKPSVEELFTFYPEPGKSELERVFSACAEKGTPFDIELPFVTAKGENRWVRVVGEACWDGAIIVRVQGAMQDITEAKLAMTSLAASEERFRILADAMPMIVWTADSEGEVDFSNKYFTDYTGVPQSEPPESRWQKTVHPDDLVPCMEAWAESVQTGANFEFEYRRKNGATGEYRWFLVRAQSVRDKDGNVTKWYGTGTDIQDTKALQEEASGLAESLSTTLESITDGFLTLDTDWRFTYVNAEAERLVSKSREEMIGKVVWEVFPESVDTAFYINYHKAVNEGVSVSFEEYYEPLDRWLDVHAYPSSEGIAVHFRDVSDRKHYMQKLQEQTSFLTHAQRIGRMGSYTADVNTRKIEWSDTACELFGIPPDERETALENFLEFVVPEDREMVISWSNNSEALSQTVERHFRIKRRDGEVRWIAGRGSTELDADGNPVRRLGMIRDITEQQLAKEALQRTNVELENLVAERTSELAQINQQLLIAKDQAEMANVYKSTFLSRMSHELRTPMNAILGFGQLLELSELDDESRDSLTHILKAGKHLLNLINDVLEISRVEIGEVSLSLEPVEVAELLNECHSLMRTIARDQEVSISVESGSSIYVMADRQKLRQIVLNLISNGIKYNKRGGRVELSVAAEDEGRVRIAVTDTGIGISETDLEKLFTPFERLGAGAIEGTGLGLSLSRSLTEAMGGTLTAASENMNGACFTIELRSAGESRAEVKENLSHLGTDILKNSLAAKLLIIEDNLTNVVLLERVFSPREGVEFLVAMQGRLGLELAMEHKPDVILLDLHLPDISGKEVMLELKSDPELKDIPIIIMSADAFSSRAESLMRAGAYRYITKPFNLLDLLQTIDDALQLRENNDG